MASALSERSGPIEGALPSAASSRWRRHSPVELLQLFAPLLSPRESLTPPEAGDTADTAGPRYRRHRPSTAARILSLGSGSQEGHLR